MATWPTPKIVGNIFIVKKVPQKFSHVKEDFYGNNLMGIVFGLQTLTVIFFKYRKVKFKILKFKMDY